METSVPEVVRKGNTDFSNPSRKWIFTVNNYTERDIAWAKSIEAKCMTVSKEVGESGTPHLQGRVIFKRNYRLAQLKKLHGKANWLIMIDENDNNYVRKVDSDIIIDYDHRRQGARTDLNEIKDEIMKGKSVDDIALENPQLYHQYGRTLEKLEDLKCKNKFRTEMTEGIWIHGETGTGKSHLAFEDYNENTHYLWNNIDKGWWDGYNGQETVILNDFRGEIPYGTLLQLIDRWPFNVPRRSRKPVPFLAKKIIITSSLPPDKIYKNRDAEDKIEQLLRRLKIIKL